MVESTGLENRRAFTGPAGSNPAPSAIRRLKRPTPAPADPAFEAAVPPCRPLLVSVMVLGGARDSILARLGQPYGLRLRGERVDLSVA